jgi:hypothetical protein
VYELRFYVEHSIGGVNAKAEESFSPSKAYDMVGERNLSHRVQVGNLEMRPLGFSRCVPSRLTWLSIKERASVRQYTLWCDKCAPFNELKKIHGST